MGIPYLFNVSILVLCSASKKPGVYLVKEYTPTPSTSLASPNTKFQSSLGYKSHIVIADTQKASAGVDLAISVKISPALT